MALRLANKNDLTAIGESTSLIVTLSAKPYQSG
jgi:hypothetical protein